MIVEINTDERTIIVTQAKSEELVTLLVEYSGYEVISREVYNQWYNPYNYNSPNIIDPPTVYREDNIVYKDYSGTTPNTNVHNTITHDGRGPG